MNASAAAGRTCWRSPGRSIRIRIGIGSETRSPRETKAAPDPARSPMRRLQKILGDQRRARGGGAAALGAKEEAVALLSQAASRTPNDFWINQVLGYHLGQLQPPRWDEAVRFLTVAVALRPDSPGADEPGVALAQQKRLKEAVLSYRRAVSQAGLRRGVPSMGEALIPLGRPGRAVAACGSPWNSGRARPTPLLPRLRPDRHEPQAGGDRRFPRGDQARPQERRGTLLHRLRLVRPGQAG